MLAMPTVSTRGYNHFINEKCQHTPALIRKERMTGFKFPISPLLRNVLDSPMGLTSLRVLYSSWGEALKCRIKGLQYQHWQ